MCASACMNACVSFATKQMFQFWFQFIFLFFFFISLKLFFILETSLPGNQLLSHNARQAAAIFLKTTLIFPSHLQKGPPQDGLKRLESFDPTSRVGCLGGGEGPSAKMKVSHCGRVQLLFCCCCCFFLHSSLKRHSWVAGTVQEWELLKQPGESRRARQTCLHSSALLTCLWKSASCLCVTDGSHSWLLQQTFQGFL